MSEETKTVSVSVPRELVEGVNELAAKTNAANAVENEVITLKVTPQQAQRLTELREELDSFQKSQFEEWQADIDDFIKTSGLRISFFDKLILLAGGTFALSFTFLGALQRRVAPGTARPLSGLRSFEFAWVMLLLCIVCSWLHNLLRSTAVENLVAWKATKVAATQHRMSGQIIQRIASLFRAMEVSSPNLSDWFVVAAAEIGQFETNASKWIPDFTEKTTRFSRTSATFGGLALWAIVTAFGLMIWFAIKNAALL